LSDGSELIPVSLQVTCTPAGEIYYKPGSGSRLQLLPTVGLHHEASTIYIRELLGRGQ